MKYLSFFFIFLISCCSHEISPKIESSIKDRWESPLSWPAQTIIEGTEVKLWMIKSTPYNISEIKSADELNKNDGCAAHYFYMEDGKKVLHGPAFTWKPDGRIEKESFKLNGKLQYLRMFYPTGEIILSVKYNKDTNQLIINWFEKNGDIVGQNIINNKPSGQMKIEDDVYYWNGKKVSYGVYLIKTIPYNMLSLQ